LLPFHFSDIIVFISLFYYYCLFDYFRLLIIYHISLSLFFDIFRLFSDFLISFIFISLLFLFAWLSFLLIRHFHYAFYWIIITASLIHLIT